MIEILEPGRGTTVQDLGRRGWAAWGVSSGGAADRPSMRLANRLVGNREDAAVLEVLLGGLSLRAVRGVYVAVTGAPAPVLLDGARAGFLDGPLWLPAGTTLTLGTPAEQLRTYVAVRGGLDTEQFLGSRSVDEAGGIGRAARAGDVYRVGTPDGPLPAVDQAPRPRRPAGPLLLTGTGGPRDDWFDDASLARFTSQIYAVLPAADRLGVRLGGEPLQRAVAGELISEPTRRGAVEVPADGQPIVFGADHPTTCGYPVIAVLDADSADALSQCRPGDQVTFRISRPEVRLAVPTRPSEGPER